jgi:hypothetical protein
MGKVMSFFVSIHRSASLSSRVWFCLEPRQRDAEQHVNLTLQVRNERLASRVLICGNGSGERKSSELPRSM